jgi:hypothetical protein
LEGKQPDETKDKETSLRSRGVLTKQMGLNVKQEPIPGYYTEVQYDTVRNNLYKTEKELEKLKARLEDETLAKERTEKKLADALFYKADELAKQGTIDPTAEGELRVSDPKVRQEIAFCAMNKKIPVILIKFIGTQVVGARLLDDNMGGNGKREANE